MITDEKFCDRVHMNIHAVRLLKNYKASEFEKSISELVILKFSPICNECRMRGEMNRLQMLTKKQGFLSNIFGG